MQQTKIYFPLIIIRRWAPAASGSRPRPPAQTGRSRNELVGIFLEYALDHCEIEEGTRNES